MLRILLPVLIAATWSSAALAQRALPLEEGSPYYLHAFDAQAYNAHSQNWSVIQDKRGLIYVANTNGVLEYDGRTWRLITLPEGGDQAVRSLARSHDGTVFVGGGGEVGFLAPDSVGQLRYESLVDRIKPEDRGFSDVWTTHAVGDTVFFQASDRLIRWDGRRMKTWRTDTRFHKAFTVGGTFYVREDDVGLQRLEGDRLKTIPGGEQFALESIYAMLPHPEGLLVGTRSQGFFLLDRTGARPYQTEADAYLSTYRPYSAIVLDGVSESVGRLYVVTTFGGGVLLLDEHGRLLRVYREDAGIAPDNLVMSATLDKQGGLWLALDNGVRRVDVLTPLTQFGLVHGLKGTVYDALRHDGTLYVATSTGLFRLVRGETGVATGGQPRYARFEQVEGIPEQVWALLSDPAGLLVATNDGVYLLKRDGLQILRADKAFALYRSPSNPTHIFIGLKDGLAVLERRGGTWREGFSVQGLNDEIRSMEEDHTGRLWVAPIQGGLKRLTWRPETPTQPRIRAFGEAEGLPGGTLSIWVVGGELGVITREGVYRLQDGRAPRFVLDQPLADALGDRDVVVLSEGPSRRVWVYDGETISVLAPTPGGGYRDVTPAVLRLRSAQIRIFSEEPDGSVWLGSESGLLRYDPRMGKDYEVSYSAQIRAVLGRPADLLFGGAFGEGSLSSVQTDGNFLVLPYERNGLRFEYAAPSYNFPGGTEFQYRLEGFEDTWSVWSTEDHTEFTNLPEHRNYRFHVRARNAQGLVSEEVVFAFRVLPPWYRTWWAYALYVLTFGSVLWGFSAWRLRQHRRALEQSRMVNERLERMNARLADTNERLLQADRLKDDLLANTSHELRTPLTAILGFSSVLQEDGDEDQRELAGAIHRSGQRLLDTVNGLLDMAKLQANLLELRSAELDVAEVSRDVLAMLRPLAEERGLYLRLMPEGLPVLATTDRYALERILINLASNALKFTESGGVTVLLDATDDEIHITVRDTGIGIEPTFLPHLFDAFRQASTGYGRSHEGSGLGLTIVKRVVELLGGQIRVESLPGEGTAFAVVLPRHLAGEPLVEAARRRPFSPTSEPALDGARLLALTADAGTQERLRSFVGHLCTLVVAETPREVLSEARATPFDVVLVEQRGETAEEHAAVVEAVSALPGYARVPVIVLVEEAGGDGVVAVPTRPTLPLPLDQDALLHLLQSLLTRTEGALAD